MTCFDLRIVLVGRRPIGLVELPGLDAGEIGPELLGGIEAQSLVQVEPQPELGFVDVEEAPQPRREHQDKAEPIGEATKHYGRPVGTAEPAEQARQNRAVASG